MPATSPTPPLATRQRLLDAAAFVFARKGLEGATTREIARRAKVNEVTLFRHFQTKEKLLGAVLRETFEPPAKPAPVRARPRPLPALRRDLHRFAAHYALLLERNILLIRTVLASIHRYPKREKQVLHNIFAPLKTDLVAALQTARDKGAIRPDVDPLIAADLFSSMIFMGVLRCSLPYDPGYTPAQHQQAMLDTFLRGIAK